MNSFAFAHPALVLGLLGIAVPIIIHFIFRRRSRQIEFSAMRFVLLSYKKTARRLLLQEYLLLAARCLLVALLALALAGPLLSRPVSGFVRGDKPLAVMFILDTSPSMRRTHEGKTLLEQSKDRIGEWLSQWREGDRMGLIDGVRRQSSGLKNQPEEIRRQLDEIEPGYAPAALLESVALAASQLAAFPHCDRLILIFTDLQRASWSGPAPGRTELPTIYVVDMAADLPLRNLALRDLEIKRTAPGRQESRELKVKLINYGQEAVPGVLLRASLEGEAAAQGFVDTGAGEAVEKILQLPAEASGAGQVTIETDDGMPEDNILYFHLKGGQEVRALVVDGDPSTSYLEAETYFLEQALDPRLYARSRVKPRTITVPELAGMPLEDYDVIILANLAKLEAGEMERVKKFVSEGGGLLVTLGDKVNADRYNAMFGNLLPRELRGEKLSYAGARAPGEVQKMHLEMPALTPDTHPILSVFRDPSEGDLGLANFTRYFLVQQEVTPRSRVILRLTDGTPIMVEGAYGRGRVILFASTVDRAWNDLCIHPTYLPLMQQTVQYLADALLREETGRLTAGSVIEVLVPAEVTGGRLLDPGGKVRPAELIAEAGARRLRLPATERPGIYYLQIQRPGLEFSSVFRPEDADRIIVLNFDPAESDLSRISGEELRARLGAEGVRIIRPEEPLEAEADNARQTKSYAGLLLALLGLTAGLERFLARS